MSNSILLKLSVNVKNINSDSIYNKWSKPISRSTHRTSNYIDPILYIALKSVNLHNRKRKILDIDSNTGKCLIRTWYGRKKWVDLQKLLKCNKII